MICLGNCRGGGGRWALQNSPIDGEMVFDERLLKQGGEVKTLRVACVGAVGEQGKPFEFGGSCLREQIAEELLGGAADLFGRFREAEDGGWEPP